MQTPQGFRLLSTSADRISHLATLSQKNKSEVVRDLIIGASSVPKKVSRIQVSFSLDDSTREKLRKLCLESGRSESEVLEALAGRN
jgi:hypothetical protein